MTGMSDDIEAPENPGNCIFDMSRSERTSFVTGTQGARRGNWMNDWNRRMAKRR